MSSLLPFALHFAWDHMNKATAPIVMQEGTWHCVFHEKSHSVETGLSDQHTHGDPSNPINLHYVCRIIITEWTDSGY